VTIVGAITSLEQWLDRHQWRAWEPHDGLNTPLRRLAGNNRTLLLALKQIVLRSPWNLRPLLGIRAATSPEARGFFARGYLRLYAALGDERFRLRAVEMLDRLHEDAERGYSGACWGNKFDYITRFFYLPAGTPIVVWTAHNAHAYVDAYEQLGDRKYLDIARSAAEFILRDLPRHHENGTECISYVPIGDHPVHNANVLGASLLARVGKITGEEELIATAKRAIAYTAAHQRSDGSWWYGEAENLRWVDNFHTGYVLESMQIYRDASGDHYFDESLRRGFEYYEKTFFEDDGMPRYFSDKAFPADIQCAAQSIETLRMFDRVEHARRVAEWTLENLRDRDGYFYFRRHKRLVSRTPLLHWGQATMFSALAGLLENQEVPS